MNEWVSETIFNTLFVSFVVWTFSPFWTATKRFYTAVIYARLLMVLCGASVWLRGSGFAWPGNAIIIRPTRCCRNRRGTGSQYVFWPKQTSSMWLCESMTAH